MCLLIYQEEIKQVEEDQTRAKWQHKALKSEQEDSELPEVLDYIKISAEVTDLEKKVRRYGLCLYETSIWAFVAIQVIDWERKIEIAELENKRKAEKNSLRRTLK